MREPRSGLGRENGIARPVRDRQGGRIVFVSHSGDRTGAPIVLTRLFRWALTREHEDAYLVFRYAGRLAEACRSEFPPGRVFVLRQKSPRLVPRPIKPFSKCHDLVSLLRILAPLRPTVVVVNSLINALAVVAGRLLGSRVILWVHEVPGSANDPFDLRSLVNRRAHVGIGVSSQSCAYLREIGFPPSRVLRIPHGLDLSAWAGPGPPDTTRPVEGNRLTLGALATWSPNKRLDLIVETSIMVAKERQEIHVHLRLGGSEDADSPRLFDQTRQRYSIMPSNLQVEWLGPVEDVAGFYRGLDALLVASEKESLPTVALEALACDVPTFSFADVPGVKEVLGADRFLAKARTSVALAAEIVDFFYRSPQPDALEAWKQYARERIQQFSVEAQWKTFRAVIDRSL